jgi:hypothetical protein
MSDFNYRAAATEFRVACPKPGTDAAKLLICAHNARWRCGALETENLRLLAEIDEWKDASGLERGGDPDGVTPDDLRNEMAHLRTTQEKSWGAADDAMCAQYEAVIRDLVDACDRLMGDSDLPDDNSPEMKAMKRAVAILKTRGKQ